MITVDVTAVYKSGGKAQEEAEALTGRRWTDEELDAVARYVRRHEADTRIDTWTRRESIRALAAEIGRSEYSTKLMAVAVATAAGLPVADSTVAWFRQTLKDLGPQSRCLAAWNRTAPESATEIAQRLGYGPILDEDLAKHAERFVWTPDQVTIKRGGE
jgi:hypothetical protein